MTLNKKVGFESVCHIFVLTRDFIIHFKYTTVILQESIVKEKKDDEGETPAESFV